MSVTINTNATTLLPVSEFLKRADWRNVGDLVSDAGTRGTQASLTSDANLAAALLGATGEMEATCSAGNRYQPADLAALTGATLAYLYDLLATMTLVRLVRRRPDLKRPIPEEYEAVKKTLAALREGEWVFGTQEAMSAGNVSEAVETPSQVEQRNGLVIQAGRFFGRRSNDRC